jgi:hypothetical protein
MMRRLIAIVVVLAGCKERNDLFCDNVDHQNDPSCMGVTPDAPSCGAGGLCAEGVCKMPDNICVECIVNTDCTTAAEPTCGPDNTCRRCEQHADCDSRACLPEGTCVAEGMVAYVKSGGGGTACSKDVPCDSVQAAVANLGARTHIKIEGTAVIKANGTNTINDTDVTILADKGATLSRNDAGDILEVTGTSTVTVYDLTITGASGGNAVSIGGSASLTLERVKVVNNAKLGLRSTGATQLTLKQSLVIGNLEGGGDLQNLVTNITNNIFVGNGNGTATGTIGGLLIKPNAGSVFEFNTIADNSSNGATVQTRGVNCILPFSATSSIVTGNKIGLGCTFDNSLFDAGSLPSAGVGNIVGDPAFLNLDLVDLTSPTLYRIGPTSAAIDAAGANGDSTTDIDGDARPAGAKDMGADERP